jgi:hypothetical protein
MTYDSFCINKGLAALIAKLSSGGFFGKYDTCPWHDSNMRPAV